MSDLRESGSLEQDADMVIFLTRPAYYLEQDEESTEQIDGTLPQEATAIIAKNRHGPTQDVPLLFLPALTRFENPARLN